MEYKNIHAFGDSYTRCVFQLSVELLVKDHIYGTTKYCGVIIYDWAKNKFSNLHLPNHLHTYTKRWSGCELDVIYNNDKPYFCMRVSHPDEKIPQRQWTIDTEIMLREEKLMFGVKVLYTSPASENSPDVNFSIPGFVNRVYFKNGFKDVWQLQLNAHCVCKEDIEILYDFIENEKRRLPVVVITERYSTGGIGSQYQSGYLVDGNNLAKKIGMFAHIICLNYEASQIWTQYVGKNWSVFDGGVRIYYPGVKFEDDTYLRHPLITAYAILHESFEDENGREYIAGKACELILAERVKKYNTTCRLNWNNIGYKFYLNASLEMFQNNKSNYEETIRLFEDEYKSNQETINLLDENNKELEAKYNQAKGKIHNLNLLVTIYRHQLDEIADAKEKEIPILNSYEELPDWIDQYFPGRLVLHPRAKRSLKNAEFQDVILVYKALKLLGTTYWEMRTGTEITREEFDKQCDDLGIDETPVGNATSTGEFWEKYTVDYEGEKRKLDHHIRKGVAKDPRWCMRIYFFWDDESEEVVIGELPWHLVSRAT